jgi:hypothetical protein
VPRKAVPEPANELVSLVDRLVDEAMKKRRFRPTPARAAMSKRDFGISVDLGISSVEKEIREGRLEAKKIGYRTIITTAERERWLAALPSIKPAPSSAAELEAVAEARRRYLASRKRVNVACSNSDQRQLSSTA